MKFKSPNLRSVLELVQHIWAGAALKKAGILNMLF